MAISLQSGNETGNITDEQLSADKDRIIFNGKQYKFATMNRRLIAIVLDMFIILVFIGPFLNLSSYYLYQRQLPYEITEPSIMQYNDANQPDVVSGLVQYLSEFFKYLVQNGFILKYMLAQFIAFIVLGAFMTYFWKKKGATPGKLITRCVIVDATTGNIPSYKQSLIRFMGYVLSTLPLCVGFLIIPITKRKQGFHDMSANTVVIVKPWKSK